MIPLSKYRSLLGVEGQHLTDAEVKVLYDNQYQMAELAFQMWMKKQRLNDGGTTTIPLNPQI